MNQKPKNEASTFSKSILSTVVLLYFIGAIIGAFLVVTAARVDIKLNIPLNSTMFIAYATYIGGPTATAIGFYAWKSKAENLLKITKSFDTPSASEVASVLATIKEE